MLLPSAVLKKFCGKKKTNSVNYPKKKKKGYRSFKITTKKPYTSVLKTRL